jgi:hypothetical protein
MAERGHSVRDNEGVMSNLNFLGTTWFIIAVACGACAGSEEPDDVVADAGRDPDLGRGTDERLDASAAHDAAHDASRALREDAAKQSDELHRDGSAEPLATRKPKCVKQGRELLMIGDSYLSWPSHTFPTDMIAVSGQTWRMKAEGGYSLATGGLGLIPSEYDHAMSEDSHAHTVLMDGGGNDILVSFNPEVELVCKDIGSSKSPACQKVIHDALEAAGAMFDRMAAAGIRDVVYFFYPHIPEGRLLGGPHPNEILDYALPLVHSFCDGAATRTSGRLRCHFIDMIPVFAGQDPSVWFNLDIHPTPVASKAMAKKVWEVMTERCVGQEAKMGCCEP